MADEWRENARPAVRKVGYDGEEKQVRPTPRPGLRAAPRWRARPEEAAPQRRQTRRGRAPSRDPTRRSTSRWSFLPFGLRPARLPAAAETQPYTTFGAGEQDAAPPPRRAHRSGGLRPYTRGAGPTSRPSRSSDRREHRDVLLTRSSSSARGLVHRTPHLPLTRSGRASTRRGSRCTFILRVVSLQDQRGDHRQRNRRISSGSTGHLISSPWCAMEGKHTTSPHRRRHATAHGD